MDITVLHNKDYWSNSDAAVKTVLREMVVDAAVCSTEMKRGQIEHEAECVSVAISQGNIDHRPSSIQ